MTGCVEVILVRPDGGGGSADAGVDAGGNPEVDAGDPIVRGTPTGSWTTIAGSLKRLTSNCGPVAFLVPSPHENRLLIGIADRGLYSSTDGAKTWTQLATGAGSEKLDMRMSQIIFDPDHADTYYVAGIYHPPGLFVTKDNGNTFRSLGEAWHSDTMSVDFTDPERRTVIAGGHEQSNKIWLTRDGGMTWKNIGANLQEHNWALFVHAVDATTYLVGCINGAGVYRTTDAGETWNQQTDLGGAATPLIASDGLIYWPSPDGSLALSMDNGESWEEVTPGGVLYPIRPIELPDGRIASRGAQGTLVSDDQGAHWTLVAPPEPFNDPGRAFDLAYSKHEKAFFVTAWVCTASEQPVARYDWDYEEE